MSDFRQVTSRFWASPQITIDDVAEAKALGFTLIVNNRPEGEAPDQTEGGQIEQAARAAGMDYIAIPVSPGGFDEEQVQQMAQALANASGPVLAYCRSGTRSTLLWSLARALEGAEPEEIAADAAGAGYDVAPLRHVIEALAARNR